MVGSRVPRWILGRLDLYDSGETPTKQKSVKVFTVGRLA
jgi:hypothetical protein